MQFSKINKNYLILLAIAVSLSACGQPQKSAQPAAASAPVAAVAPSGNYVTANNLQLPQGEGVASPVLLPKGTAVTVLETREDPQQGSMVRLGIDTDDANLPSEVWMKQEDALRAGLIEAPNVGIDPAAPATETGEFIDSGADAGMTYCYRFVKEYLLQTGKVSTYLPGGSAWMAASILPRYGFRSTGTGPAGAIEGDVCVYSGGKGGNGHIEVKRDGGWWYGYGVKPEPITPVGHHLLGCFRK
jgi:hypothetical protein